MVEKEEDPAWGDGPEAEYKLLVIVYRIAAKRLGFGQLYESMNDKAPAAFGNGLLNATA